MIIHENLISCRIFLIEIFYFTQKYLQRKYDDSQCITDKDLLYRKYIPYFLYLNLLLQNKL